MPGGATLEIRAFTDDVIDDAARLLAERHRAQRLIEPGLAPRFERRRRRGPRSRRSRRRMARRARSRCGAASSSATSSGRLALPMWGPNIWVEGAGHAVVEPEVDPRPVRVRRRALGRRRGDQPLRGRPCDGRGARRRLVPGRVRPAARPRHPRAGDGRARSCGRRPASSSGTRSVATSPCSAGSRSRSPSTRPGRRSSPVSPCRRSRTPPTNGRKGSTTRPSRRSWPSTTGGWSGPRSVARSRRRRSTRASSGRPAPGSSASRRSCRRHAASAPGRALGEAVLIWARDAGHPTVVTDWRETNLLSSRAWPRLGFRPTFRRLFRAIA